MAARRIALTDDRSIGDQLAEWGKVAILETTGRSSGTSIRTAVGFFLEPDASLLIAAGADDADWALNLSANPKCSVSIGDLAADFTAVEVEGAERARAISGLILKYGTPAERLGRGPVFRLSPS